MSVVNLIAGITIFITSFIATYFLGYVDFNCAETINGLYSILAQLCDVLRNIDLSQLNPQETSDLNVALRFVWRSVTFLSHILAHAGGRIGGYLNDTILVTIIPTLTDLINRTGGW